MPLLLDAILRALLAVAGLALIAVAFFSAVRTFVLPRSAPDPVVRVVFRSLRRGFNALTRRSRNYGEADAVMAFFAPTALLALLPVWLMMIGLGYACLYEALGGGSWFDALVLSGSSLLTLGYAHAEGWAAVLLSFSEAALGLMLVAILIAYLPTIYSAFSRRESAVSLLEVRAGSPPSAVEMILRYNRLHGLDRLSELWPDWEIWFTEIEESHTSLAALVFFRSPKPERSWVTAAGAVLDAAALANAALDIPHDLRADLTIRAGFLALRSIADFFGVHYNPNPKPTDPISVSRAEFDAACDRMTAAGVPLKPDRDQAWRDFAGWRVNYDRVLVSLAFITMAPQAPWSSDRTPDGVRSALELMQPKRLKRAGLAQFSSTPQNPTSAVSGSERDEMNGTDRPIETDR
jgi:hypothetical protein